MAAGEAMYASGGAFQRIQGDVLDALKDLPDQISAEEYIAEEVKQALREQTQGISSQLSDVLRGDNPSNIASNLAGHFATLAGGIDGVLTREQLAIVMSGKATDAELRAIMRAVDLNGDGVMDGLESVIIQSLPTDAVLGTLLRNKMNELDKNQLTHAQVRSALSPIATDAEISRLIREVDVNAGGIAKSLNPAFDMLDANLDGKLTYAELVSGLDGMATDAQLHAIARAVDLNGDGVINGLESVVIAGMPTDAVLGTLALSPIAKQGQINQLINRADRNADGIITAQELANASLDGLASGIGSALYPMFDSLDSSLDGLIDYAEFASAFEGMATDAQLRELFNMLDANGDGQLSKLEALEQSSEGTEDNTKTMDERAREQLSKLVELSQEMALTTDQFVGLNSGITSLTKSINALGVAQAEVARIERERAAAEKAERDRIQREREQAARVASLEAGAQQSLADMQEWQRQAQATVVGNNPEQKLSQRRNCFQAKRCSALLITHKDKRNGLNVTERSSTVQHEQPFTKASITSKCGQQPVLLAKPTRDALILDTWALSSTSTHCRMQNVLAHISNDTLTWRKSSNASVARQTPRPQSSGPSTTTTATAKMRTACLPKVACSPTLLYPHLQCSIWA